MSGVSIVGPAPKSIAEQDLEAAYAGGANFVTRVQALSDARTASEKALADLQLGRDAAAALEDAKQKQVAAEQALQEAAIKDARLNAFKNQIGADPWLLFRVVSINESAISRWPFIFLEKLKIIPIIRAD
jgi:hypothetical protein